MGRELKLNSYRLLARLGERNFIMGLLGLFLASVVIGGSALAADLSVPAPARASENEIVGRYLTANQQQQAALRGVSMEVDIDANVPKLQKQGKLHALRNISKLGTITYKMLGFNGDNSVKKEVIARYLAAEVESQTGPNISITPANYNFKVKGLRDGQNGAYYVLAVSPRKKTVGLFKGEIWLDRQTFLPLRESGRFVKNPSVFLKRMEFIKTYSVQDGVAIPQTLRSYVDTRLFGPVELTIDFTHFSKSIEPELAVVTATND